MKCTYLDMGAASGSLGGKVFSRNHYGNYLRTRAVPVNPNSSRQQGARASFSEMASRWSLVLTQAQRTAWNLYGASVAMTDRIGQPIYLTGFAHYIRSNTAKQAVGLGVVDAGPVIYTVAESDGSLVATISEATQKITLAFDDTMDWCDEDEAHMSVYMTSPQTASREYLDIKLRLAGALEGDSVSPPTTPDATLDVPYVVVETQKVIVKARIGRADGRLSYFFQSTVTVAA